MNLTRLREIEFQNEVLLIMDGYENGISGDQDIINIYLHYHPCELMEIPTLISLHCAFRCDSKFRSCIRTNLCIQLWIRTLSVYIRRSVSM